MAKNRRDRVQRLRDAAVEKDPGERAAYLEGVADSDPELREEVESLLAVSREDGPVENVPSDTGSDRSETLETLPAIRSLSKTNTPERIGPYRILREIGEGGMGIVHEAEQQEPVRRKVALKLIKWGMDTKAVIGRFESERQALALMNHPNIASVFDAGATSEGRPYFAMEYVHGITITEYCDKHRLTIKERVELIIQVCEGVQHAHQKGIIHRDIKPSNVLVAVQNDKPVPKIIDFGVAKATSQRLTEHTVATELGQLIGTPEYMSPEQAEMTNLDVDTRTDVYSLGVLLYELLVGALPFDGNELRAVGLAEIQRRLREDEPPRPSARITSLGEVSRTSASNRKVELSTMPSVLRGDLDWITMKAMEKDRTRRYETAHGLALDLRRYLDDEPVLAGPPSTLYRFRKLMRRHKGAFAALSAILVSLMVGVMGTSWGLLRAVRAERRAADDAAIAEAVNDFLNVDLLGAAVPSAAPGEGRDVTVREVLDLAAGRIDEASTDGGRFASQPLVEASIRETIADTYRQLGEYAAAEPHIRRAVDLRLKAQGEEDPDTAAAINRLGLLHWRQGRLEEAESDYRKSFGIAERVLGEDHPATLAYQMNLANLYRWQGHFQEAEHLYEINLAARRRVLGPEHPDTLDTMGNFANQLQETGRYERAEALHRQVLDTRRRVVGENDRDTVAVMNNLANDLALVSRFEEAEPLMRRSYELKIELYGEEHPTTLNSLNNLAELNNVMGRDEEALPMHRRVLEARTRLLGPNHPRTLQSMKSLAETLSNLGQFAEADRLATRATAQLVESLGEGHPLALDAQDILAMARLGLGRPEEAESILRHQLAILEQKKGGGESTEDDASTAQLLRAHLGMALAGLGRRTEAESLLLESIPELPPREAATTRALDFLVRFYVEWDQLEPGQGHAARATEWRQRLETSRRGGMR